MTLAEQQNRVTELVRKAASYGIPYLEICKNMRSSADPIIRDNTYPLWALDTIIESLEPIIEYCESDGLKAKAALLNVDILPMTIQLRINYAVETTFIAIVKLHNNFVVPTTWKNVGIVFKKSEYKLKISTDSIWERYLNPRSIIELLENKCIITQFSIFYKVEEKILDKFKTAACLIGTPEIIDCLEVGLTDIYYRIFSMHTKQLGIYNESLNTLICIKHDEERLIGNIAKYNSQIMNNDYNSEKYKVLLVNQFKSFIPELEQAIAILKQLSSHIDYNKYISF